MDHLKKEEEEEEGRIKVVAPPGVKPEPTSWRQTPRHVPRDKGNRQKCEFLVLDAGASLCQSWSILPSHPLNLYLHSVTTLQHAWRNSFILYVSDTFLDVNHPYDRLLPLLRPLITPQIPNVRHTYSAAGVAWPRCLN